MDYGSIIRTLRERLAMTQEEFAALIGVSRVAIVRWENEERIPRAEYKKKIIELAEKHNVEIKYFLYMRK